tara:strand:+ start:72 stop:464 length:393 start_codon:yes stop_codon:yes gene_type:complete
MVERVVTQQVAHLMVEHQLNQKVVAIILYLIVLVEIVCPLLLQLVVVQEALMVLLVDLVDLEVVNHIQEMVDLEVLEEQNQEQIQHLKEILPRIIKVVEIVINVAAAVEQILIPPHYHSRKDLQVLLYLG